MNTEVRIPDEIITSKILLIRGQKVMIDSDIAELYGVTTKRPESTGKYEMKIVFLLTLCLNLPEEENNVRWLHNCNHLKNLKFSSFLPKVFTEHGVHDACKCA